METTQIHSDVAVYFCTFTIVHWLPVFVSQEACLILTDSLNFCHRNKNLRINTFVVMPTHCHLILFDADFDQIRLHRTITAVRQYTGRQLVGFCKRTMPAVFSQLMQAAPRSDRRRQFWQPGKHPVGLFSRPFWLSKLNYVHNNPCRKGLVRNPADWRFSSAAYWQTGDARLSDVVLSELEWV